MFLHLNENEKRIQQVILNRSGTFLEHWERDGYEVIFSIENPNHVDVLCLGRKRNRKLATAVMLEIP